MKRKYSTYYKVMILLSLFALYDAIVVLCLGLPAASAILFTISFILWYAGVMAPDTEKYKKPINKYTPKL